MNKKLLTYILLFLLSLMGLFNPAIAASTDIDREYVMGALTDYINGTSFNNKKQIANAFYPGANLYLEKAQQPLWTVPVKDYISWFAAREEGQFNGRVGEILNIDIEGKIATAKVEILIPSKQLRFVDMFLLKKLDGKWQIISKSAVQTDNNNNGERILFIVSNAHFHGNSDLPAGASFSELVNAHHTFKEAGFTVDFVSPKGGAVPFTYMNTSIPRHKQYVYDQDFMHALANTKSPQQINPEDYKAVHYIGGSNAMYGVAEDKAIQDLAMTIYEQHGGIISSVCHGTAGIVNLKTRDGRYLVKGKRISGYPDSFENQSREYFKQFPFLIQQTIEQRGGDFRHGARNTAHVEVDGRVITGQNHLSSEGVAKAIIEALSRR